ncbi:CysS/YqeB C-terminal domain-containing protein [Streptomyces sp. DT190]
MLSARARARTHEDGAADARQLRGEPLRTGVVVRDEDERQHRRAVGG